MSLAGAAALLLTLAGPHSGGAQPTPTPLDTRVAWARLLGYVRFFHPSDAVADCDWNAFATNTAKEVDGAAGPTELAAALERIFRPVAPTLRVFPAGQAAPPVPELAEAEGDPRRVRWLHHGVGLGFGKIYGSERIDSADRPTLDLLVQSLAARPSSGEARLGGEIVTELEPGALLEVRFGGQTAQFTTSGRHRLDLRASAATEAVIAIHGAGRLWLDDFRSTAGLANGDFELGALGRQPPGWTVPYPALRGGFRVALAQGGRCPNETRCVEVTSSALSNPPFPPPRETLRVELGGGVEAALPLVLPKRDGVTFPVPFPAQCRPGEGVSDRQRHLAAAAEAWAILRHFHPNAPAVGDPVELLAEALRGALEATDDDAFLGVLRRLGAAFGDAALWISRRGQPPPRALPLEWRTVDGRVLVTTAFAPGPSPGDEVTAIDGVATEVALARLIPEAAGATPAARRTVALERLRWNRGEAATLTLESPAGARREVTLPRVDPVTLETWAARDRSEPIRELGRGVLYADLTRLETAGLEAAAARLAAARAIVFDLRGDAAVGTEVLSHLIDGEVPSGIWEVPVTWLPDQREVHPLRTVWTIGPRSPRFPDRVAFLFDERATGYTETLLAMAEHQRLGLLVGSPSGASSGTINRTELPGGFVLTFAGQSVLKPDGAPHHGVGIHPTVPVVPTRAGVAAGRDEVLEEALRRLD